MFEPLLPVNFLRRAARLFPDKVAVVDGERRDTYRTLAARVNRLSNALRQMGVGQGDKVAVLSPTAIVCSKPFRRAALGRHLDAAELSPEHPRFCVHPGTFRDQSGAGLGICPATGPIVDTLKGVWHYVLRDAEPPTARCQPRITKTCWRPPAQSSPSRWRWTETDIATLNYTSGTTARPKGVMLSHRACVTARA